MAARELVPSVSLVPPAASLDAGWQLAPFTSGLGPKGRAALVRHLHHVSLPTGGLLFRQGEIGDAVYFVTMGRVAVLVTRDDGREIRVAETGPGEAVGEMALVSEEPRSASARAIRDCALLRLSKAAYDALLVREPDALTPFVQIMTEHVARSARVSQALAALRASDRVVLEECVAVASRTDPVALDSDVRRLYHRIAADLAVILGAQDVSWFGFASRSPKRVGRPGREALAVLPPALRAIAAVLPDALAARVGRWRAIQPITAALDRVDARVAGCVRGLVGGIAPAFVQLIARCAEESAPGPARDAALAAVLASGPADGRDEDLVAAAVRLYDEAAAEPEPKVRAELILLGTMKLGLFEQQQLERAVTGAIDDAAAEAVRAALPWLARLPPWLRAGDYLHAVCTRLLRRIAWASLTRVRVPYGNPRRGDDLPRVSARLPFPAPLSDLRNVELATLFARFDRGRQARAIDWTEPVDRMRYLTSLFRRHQRSIEFFETPVSDESSPDIQPVPN